MSKSFLTYFNVKKFELVEKEINSGFNRFHDFCRY